jgi:hypothetical protein
MACSFISINGSVLLPGNLQFRLKVRITSPNVGQNLSCIRSNHWQFSFLLISGFDGTITRRMKRTLQPFFEHVNDFYPLSVKMFREMSQSFKPTVSGFAWYRGYTK